MTSRAAHSLLQPAAASCNLAAIGDSLLLLAVGHTQPAAAIHAVYMLYICVLCKKNGYKVFVWYLLWFKDSGALIGVEP